MIGEAARLLRPGRAARRRRLRPARAGVSAHDPRAIDRLGFQRRRGGVVAARAMASSWRRPTKLVGRPADGWSSGPPTAAGRARDRERSERRHDSGPAIARPHGSPTRAPAGTVCPSPTRACGCRSSFFPPGRRAHGGLAVADRAGGWSRWPPRFVSVTYGAGGGHPCPHPLRSSSACAPRPRSPPAAHPHLRRRKPGRG